MNTIVNLTPHDITFVNETNSCIRTIPSSGVVRCAVETVQTGTFDGLPITASKFGAVVDMPEPQEGTVYIVSSLVAQALPNRSDVFIPNECVRDADGRVIGCRSLGRVKPTEGNKMLKISTNISDGGCYGCYYGVEDEDFTVSLPASVADAVLRALENSKEYVSLNGRILIEEAV